MIGVCDVCQCMVGCGYRRHRGVIARLVVRTPRVGCPIGTGAGVVGVGGGVVIGVGHWGVSGNTSLRQSVFYYAPWVGFPFIGVVHSSFIHFG